MILKMTYTCELLENLSHEEWFSDYKSASSVERVEAFIKLGHPDPVQVMLTNLDQ
jgi:hypothetical protein